MTKTYDSEKSTTEVRQGSPRLGNFRVLIWGLVGILVAFAVIFLVFTGMSPGPGTTTGV
jgi:hypothetical protein